MHPLRARRSAERLGEPGGGPASPRTARTGRPPGRSSAEGPNGWAHAAGPMPPDGGHGPCCRRGARGQGRPEGSSRRWGYAAGGRAEEGCRAARWPRRAPRRLVAPRSTPGTGPSGGGRSALLPPALRSRLEQGAGRHHPPGPGDSPLDGRRGPPRGSTGAPRRRRPRPHPGRGPSGRPSRSGPGRAGPAGERPRGCQRGSDSPAGACPLPVARIRRILGREGEGEARGGMRAVSERWWRRAGGVRAERRQARPDGAGGFAAPRSPLSDLFSTELAPKPPPGAFVPRHQPGDVRCGTGSRGLQLRAPSPPGPDGSARAPLRQRCAMHHCHRAG